jgi:hypothetical protein
MAWKNPSRGADQLEHPAQASLGVFSAKSMLPLEFKLAYSAGDLFIQTSMK